MCMRAARGTGGGSGVRLGGRRFDASIDLRDASSAGARSFCNPNLSHDNWFSVVGRGGPLHVAALAEAPDADPVVTVGVLGADTRELACNDDRDGHTVDASLTVDS